MLAVFLWHNTTDSVRAYQSAYMLGRTSYISRSRWQTHLPI